MQALRIRAATPADLPRLTDMYNYYVINMPVTFDIEPYTVEGRGAWFGQFGPRGRYRLLVAENEAGIMAYAGTTRCRVKAAYDTTVETTVYCAPGEDRKGAGSKLYESLFQSLEGEDIRRIVAAYTLPNPASVALHARFGFKLVGVFHENGRKLGRYWDVAWAERPLVLE